jgi:hypothetical protein
VNAHEAVLSPAGAARREDILVRARAALWARRRRRAVAKATAAVVPVLAAVAAVWVLAGGARPRPTLTPGSTREAAGSVTAAAEGGLRHVVFEQVVTERGVAQRLVPTARIASIEVLDDDELLDALRAAGKPTGLIRQAGTVVTTVRVAANPEDADEPDEAGSAGEGSAEHG